MIVALGLPVSVAVPLLAGVAWTSPATPHEKGGWPLALAYGYVLGLLITVLGMRALDAVHVPINFFTAAVLPVVCAAAGFWRRRNLLGLARIDAGVARETWRALPKTSRFVVVALLALIALRVLSTGAELLPRPIFPWEAVSAVAAKARVWFESGTLEQFVAPGAWLQGAGVHTDTDPKAFALPSLLLVWTASALGQWHEGAVGFPWLMLGCCIGLALYGHLRRIGGGLAFALTATYVFISLPLVNVNMALAGAPGWIAASGVALAGCALLGGLTRPSRDMAVYGAIGATLALASQVSTLPWLLFFGMSWFIERWPKAAFKLALAIPLVLLLVVLGLLQTPIPSGGSIWQLRISPDWRESVESLFLLDNWHLLYGLVVLVTLAGRRWIFSRDWLSRTWIVAMGLGLMLLTGTLSLPGAWQGGLRQFSATALELAPMLVMWLALTARQVALSSDALPSDPVT